ncbi:MAG: fibronectin type III domain-containing protein [Acidimicrobiales bacterium]
MRTHRLAIGVVTILLVACTPETDNGSAVASSDPPPSSIALISEPPSAPSGFVVVSTGAGTIELAWDESRTDDADSYVVTRVGAAGVTVRFETADTRLIDNGLTDGDVFTYRLVAIGEGGASAPADPVSAQVGVDSNPPTVPGRPRIVESVDGTVRMEWTESRDISSVDRYVVTRSVDGESAVFEVADPSFVDEIEPGLVATYVVGAVDGRGNESPETRPVTVLTGSAADQLALVVSAGDRPTDDNAERVRDELLGAGFLVSWFSGDEFDANLTSTDDLVVLLGDVQASGFDWNLFATDANVIALKSTFVHGAGITADPPKLDRLAQLDYSGPGEGDREVLLTSTGRPKPVVYIPENEQIQGLDVWARPVWSGTIAVAGLVPEGAELADGKLSKGCRAFFPGSTESLAEFTDDAWALLVEFIAAVDDECS